MRLSDKYSIERDKYQWVLTELSEGKDKDGNPKMKSKDSYHSTLEQVSGYVTDNIATSCLDHYIKEANGIKRDIAATLKALEESQ